MKRVFSATCIAAMCAVGLAAQSTGTAGTAGQDQPVGAGQGRGGGGPRTVTGCLRAGDTAGTYMLTDIVMAGAPGAAGSTAGATAGGTGTTAGTGTGTAGATGTGAATAGGQRQGGVPTSAMLVPDAGIDLKPHVGHKVEITGSRVGGGRRGGDAATTGTATGTGAATTGAAGTATGTGTGSTSGTGTGAGATGTGQGRGGPMQMTVTAIRMVSESCS
jgi:hypothetical protein